MKRTKEIEKKALKKSFWNWFFFNLGCLNFETLQGPAFALSMLPIAKSLYPGEVHKQKEVLQRHWQFYNTEPQIGSLINGMSAFFEESLARGEIEKELIQSTKIGLMGPVAGIGDAIIQGMIVPLLLSLGIALSNGVNGSGSLLGPLFYLLTFIPTAITLSYWLYMQGYRLGFSSVKLLLSSHMQRITGSLNILALVVIGGIASSYVQVKTPIKLGNIALQDQLDGIFPRILSLFTVLICCQLLNIRKITSLKLLLILIIASLILAYLGIL